jgi:hypothetical protein
MPPAVGTLSSRGLPVSTTVTSASAMEAASAVKSASTMKATSAAESTATVVPAAYEAMTTTISASGIIATASVAASVSFMAVAPTAARITPAPTIMTPTTAISAIPEPARMSPVIPRARANKHAVYKPVRTVITVRRASIWIVVIVSIRANRRTRRVPRTNSDPEANLRLRIRERHHQDRQQRQIFHITHIRTPGPRPSCLLVAEAFSEAGWLAVHLTIASTYWNAAEVEKLLKTGWLISAMSVKISHLEAGSRRTP